MASYNFTDYESKKESRTANERVKVGYFNSVLKNDGEEAVIRLNYNTKSDFKVVTIHRVPVDGKWKNIECLKTLYESADKCPLCAAGDKVKSKIFVQLLRYEKNPETGAITAKPEVWDRGYGFVPELLEVIADAVEDGKIAANTPISDIVFKVRRVGEKGSKDTRYKLKVMQPAVVPESVFVKDFSAFKDFDSAHHDYTTKSFDDVKYYVEHNTLPEAKKEEVKEETAEAEHPGIVEDAKAFEEVPDKKEVKE